ncbi:MAG TPA: stage V sporulation protein AA [Tissierellaceae bacterium]|nr:stage V sporulation protein AA [Tissierellaceae bacterium]
MKKEKVFILLEEKFSSDLDYNILIKDVGTVYCKDDKIQEKVENLKLMRTKKEEDWDYIEKTQIINKVLSYGPQLDVDILGADDIIIEIKSNETDSGILHYMKVIFICLVLFFGAGIAIINFYEDVDMIPSLNKIYYSLTGVNKKKPLTFLIPYTIGLGLGVIMFFSRSIGSNKKNKKEPGPMELEMYMYDSDVEDYVLQDIKKEEE